MTAFVLGVSARLELLGRTCFQPSSSRVSTMHRRGAHQPDLLGVAHPVRRRDDDLVTRLVEREREVEEGVLGPDATP